MDQSTSAPRQRDRPATPKPARVHRGTQPAPPDSDGPVRAFLRIHAMAHAAMAQVQHVEASIDQWCDQASQVREHRSYAAFSDAFVRLAAVVEEVLQPASQGCLTRAGADRVTSAAQAFEGTGRALFADLTALCPRGQWTWRVRPVIEGHVELTCNGQDMPPAVRDWLNAPDDQLVEKTVFCRVPSAVSAMMAAAGDALGQVWTQGGAALHLAASAMEPDATRAFAPGLLLHNAFSVYVVSGAFVGVARRKRRDEPAPGRWWRAAEAVMAGIATTTGALASGAQAAARCAGRAGAYVGRMAINLVAEHMGALLLAAMSGAVAYAAWAPVVMLVRSGYVLLQLLMNPMAWIGTAALLAAHARRLIGAAPAVALYRQLVGAIPLLGRLGRLLAPLMTWLAQSQPVAALVQPPLPSTAVTALAAVGRLLFTCPAHGWTPVDAAALAAAAQPLLHQPPLSATAPLTTDLAPLAAHLQQAPPEVASALAQPPAAPIAQLVGTAVAVVAQQCPDHAVLAALTTLEPAAQTFLPTPPAPPAPGAVGPPADPPAGAWGDTARSAGAVVLHTASIASIAACLTGAAATGGAGLLGCIGLLVRYLALLQGDNVAAVLVRMGVTEAAAAEAVRVARLAVTALSLYNFAGWLAGAGDVAVVPQIAEYVREAGAGAEAVARAGQLGAEVGEQAQALAHGVAAAQGVADAAQQAAAVVEQAARPLRYTAAVARCLSRVFRDNGNFVVHAAQGYFTAQQLAALPDIALCLANLYPEVGPAQLT